MTNSPTSTSLFPGLIQSVAPGSLADEMGLRPGDEILAVNGHAVEDVIDVQFYAAEDEVEIRYQRSGVSGQQSAINNRQSNQPLGIEFAHPTFDIDIRRCNNLCPFCFVLQTAPRMRRTLYIKDDDYRYSFLYGHYVTLTNLSERDWARIEEQHLSPLYISVHSTDLENRRACLSNPKAPDILPQLRWLAKRGIEMHTQLVITPGLNDGKWMDKSLRDLAKLYPAVRSVSVVPVGLTKHHKYGHRPHTPEEAARVLDAVEKWQAQFGERLGVRLVYPTDEWFIQTGRAIPPKKYYDGLALEENGLGQVRGFLDEWKRAKKEIRGLENSPILQPSHATLVTGELFEGILRKAAGEFDKLAGTHLKVVGVRNERLGHRITVAGLLMGADIIAQLKEADLGAFVILPRVMFDHPQGISLDDISPLQIAKALGCVVYLADAMGDVLDALTGHNALRFDPATDSIPVEVMKAGGWAVEKYL